MKRVILWFRNDLRVHDNAILNWAVRNAIKEHSQVIPVYCFDPRFYTMPVYDYKIPRKSGINRTRFMLESVEDLRQNLESIGSGLLVAYDKPEDFIPKLVSEDANTYLIY
jgi:deoxyribodipyrimidine photo-lyase